MLSYIEYPSWISPEVIPGLPIRWYGLMYLLAFATTYLLMRAQIRRKKLDIDSDDLLNFIFWCIIGLLLGARLLSALLYEPEGQYLLRPWLIFWPFRDGTFVGLQGMSYHGGLIGAVIAGLIYCIRRGHSILLWADLTMVSVPLGYTFGRLGNFINAELYGRVSTGPTAMLFPNAARFPANEGWVIETAEKVGIPITDPDMMINLPRHPSQLYEAALEGVVLWLVLWFVVDRLAKRQGTVTASYVIGYGIARFIAEYFRQPDVDLGFIISLSGDPGPIYLLSSFGDITMGQILSALMVLAGAIMLLALHIRGRRQPKVATYGGRGDGSARASGRDEAARAARARRKRRKGGR